MIGDVIWFCGEYIEDFYVDFDMFVIWCVKGKVNGIMGDLVLYMINVVFVLIGLIFKVMVMIEIVYVD